MQKHFVLFQSEEFPANIVKWQTKFIHKILW